MSGDEHVNLLGCVVKYLRENSIECSLDDIAPMLGYKGSKMAITFLVEYSKDRRMTGIISVCDGEFRFGLCRIPLASPTALDDLVRSLKNPYPIGSRFIL